MLQTILIPKYNFTKYQAINWIMDHKYKSIKIDETENYYRFRQNKPNSKAHYYAKKLSNGIILVFYE